MESNSETNPEFNSEMNSEENLEKIQQPNRIRTRNIIFLALLGIGLLLLGLVCGYTISQSTVEAPSPVITQILVTELVQAPTQTPYPTYTPFSNPEPTQPAGTSTLSASATPAASPTPQNTPDSTALAEQAGQCLAAAGEKQPAQIVRVIDGQTIEVLLNGVLSTVKYTGVDAPVNDPIYGSWARRENYTLVVGKDIALAKDAAVTDQGNTLNRYVVADGIFVNLSLIDGGWVSAAAGDPAHGCQAIFQQAQASAEANDRGMWEYGGPPEGSSTSSEPAGTTTGPAQAPPPGQPTAVNTDSGNIVIVEIYYQGDPANKEAGEYVEIRNDDTRSIQLEGWRLNDRANHVYVFPRYSILPGKTCRVYTNESHPESCGFDYGHSISAIWTNEGDCATLKDGLGNVVDESCY